MSPNPVLAELVRNNWVENRHRGAFCVVDSDGNIIGEAGDINRRIFPRSAIKSMQALALFKSGAIEKFTLNQTDIAIACASHHGEPAHIKAVQSLLAKIGCNQNDLQCGAHAPTNRQARNKLFANGQKPGAIHNNCSGKHAGMLAVARALGENLALGEKLAPGENLAPGEKLAPGENLEGYWLAEHGVQKLVKSSIEELLGEKLSTDYCGTDGCSIPTFAAPLKSFAHGFARMASGHGYDSKTVNAVASIFAAVTTNPFLIGGTGVFDSEVMEVFAGDLVCKIGAQGVFCGALLKSGFGFALKCDDGNMEAAQTMMAAILLEYADPDPAQKRFLISQLQQVQKNWRNFEVAIMRSVALAD